MSREEPFALAAADGTLLAGLRWRPAAGAGPAGAAGPGALGGTGAGVPAIVLVHGLGEHLGRHRALAERLAGGGRLVLGADLRGHGRSGGRRGHVERFDDYIEDLDLLVAEAQRRVGATAPEAGAATLEAGPTTPVVVIGHSLGALIALRYAECRSASAACRAAPAGRRSAPAGRHSAPAVRAARAPEDERPTLAGLVLSGIGLHLTVAVPWWKRLVGRVCDRLLPTLAFDTGVDAETLSTNPAVCAAYRDDPLVHRLVTARWYAAFEAARAAALADAGRVRCPVLILHGLDDQIADADGSRRLARALPGAPVDLRLYPGARHEVFTDPACPRVLDDLEAWLQRLVS